MRALIQRVKSATVSVDEKLVGSIEKGLLVFLGIEDADSKEDIEWLSKKLANLRIFADDSANMNRSVIDVEGQVLVVSQFTLFASTKKGNRPSFIRSAKPEFANKMYEDFCAKIQQEIDSEIQKGIFGADMQVELINDGPVTISIDSKNKE